MASLSSRVSRGTRIRLAMIVILLTVATPGPAREILEKKRGPGNHPGPARINTLFGCLRDATEKLGISRDVLERRSRSATEIHDQSLRARRAGAGRAGSRRVP